MKNSVNGFSSVVSKLGKTIGIAFSLVVIKKFASQAIELASDIQEVDNVVSKAFGNMRGEMDALADTAVTKLGMSRLTAYQTGSTFMSMGKSMVSSMEDAKVMALELTKTTANMASFFNVTQDTASTALKSIYTGETETLKQFGVVMTEVNLQQFAYEKGINKSISAMSQSEKVILRYKYVMEQLGYIGDDFADTQDSWANQTRILSEQWKEFLSIVGSGLITVLTPAIKALNTMLSSLISLTRSFGTVLSDVFGIKMQSVSDSTAAIEDATGAMDEYAKSVDNASSSLGMFDKLNVVSDSKDTGENVFSSLGSVEPELGIDLSPAESTLSELEVKLKGFVTNAKEWFASIDFGPLQDGFSKLHEAIKPIASDVVESFDWFFKEVLSPLIEWGIEKLGPAVFEQVAAKFEFLATAIDTIKPGLEYFYENVLKPVGEWAGETLIWAIEEIAALWESLSILLEEKGETINDVIIGIANIFKFLWSVVSPVLNAIKTAIGTFATYIDDIIGWVIEALDSFVNGFIGNILAGDWEAAWQGLKDTVSNIFNGIKSFVIGVVNGIIDALNKISFTVPDWVPGIGGKKFGFNIPRLDDSGVTNNTSTSWSNVTSRRVTNGYVAMNTTAPSSLIDTGSNKLDQILDGLAAQGNGDMTLNVNLDGKQIYSSVMTQNSLRRNAGLPAFE